MGDSPWSNQVQNKVVIVGPGGGLFVYSPTQAKNNLVETARITGATTDKFGNVILPGDTLYMNQGGTYYALQIAGGAGAVPLVHWWVSSSDQTGTYSTLFVVGLVTSAGLNGIDLGSAAAFANPPQCFSAPLLAQDPVTPANGAETWHSLGTLANYTVNVGRYRLTAQGELELDVNVTSAGANAQTTAFSVTLPGAYQPTANTRFNPMATSRVVTAGDTWPRIVVTTAGTVQVVQTAAVSAVLGVTCTIPVN